MTTDDKLAHFMDVSMEAVTAQTNQVLDEYQAVLDGQFQTHKEEAAASQSLEIQAETESIRRDGNKTLAHEQLLIKRDLTKKNAELTEKLFSELETLLDAYKKTPEYDLLLRKQIQSARAFAKKDQLIIYLDPVDADKKHDLEEAAGCFLTISQYSFGGGTRAVIPARNILIDNSFEKKLAEERDVFRFSGGEVHAQ